MKVQYLLECACDSDHCRSIHCASVQVILNIHLVLPLSVCNFPCIVKNLHHTLMPPMDHLLCIPVIWHSESLCLEACQ